MTRFDPYARERELEAEIRVHLEMAVRERVARGEPRAEAERAALDEFGDVARVKAGARAAWGPGMAIEAQRTANDRLKQSFDSWLWAAMILATLVHGGVFALWPEMAAAVPTSAGAALDVIPMPEIPIPKAPEPLAKPALPVAAEFDIAEDITIPRSDWDNNPVETLPPPPTQREADISKEPSFTPFTVGPQILNRGEVERALQREYPPVLRDARIGGTTKVYFFIDEQGMVKDRRVHESSGFPALDAAALAVAATARFSAALNRDQHVPVWVLVPIRFQVN